MIWLRRIIVLIGIDRQQIRILRIEKQTACGMIWLRHHSWHDMASTYHSFDRYRSTTNSYIEKLTACGMIWLRHIIVLIGIDGQTRILKSKQPMA